MTKIRDRDQVVAAAAELFTSKGYEETGLDDIAAVLGTARSALYYHVSGKSELFMLVQTMRVQMLVDEMAPIVASDASASEKLKGVMRAHINHFVRFYPESKSWSFITTQPRVHDESSATLHEHQKQVQFHIRDVIREGIARGEFRADADASIAALGIIGMSNYLANWYQPGGRLTADEIADELAAMAASSLKT